MNSLEYHWQLHVCDHKMQHLNLFECMSDELQFNILNIYLSPYNYNIAVFLFSIVLTSILSDCVTGCLRDTCLKISLLEKFS